jgi:fructokinase
LYGRGNARGVIEYSLSDEELTELGIDKGLMTLVEQDTLEALFKRLAHKPKNIACGGSAGNTTLTTQAFGARTFYSCKVANDAMGDLFYQGLTQLNVATNLTEHGRDAGTTGRCLVKITPDAERTMCTHLGITQDFSDKELDEAALTHSRYLYIEGYLVASDSARAACITAKKTADTHQVKTAITLSDPNMIQFFKDGLMEMIGDGVDILFCNEAEAKLFTQTDDLSVATQVLKKSARTFAITLGSQGALIFDGQNEHLVPGETVKVINTVGAGDVFAGAFLYALTQNMSYLDAAQLANQAAGKVVTTLGPRLTVEECQAILND